VAIRDDNPQIRGGWQSGMNQTEMTIHSAGHSSELIEYVF
jgi:hypothetical protein